jgi:hypothetical protein
MDVANPEHESGKMHEDHEYLYDDKTHVFGRVICLIFERLAHTGKQDDHEQTGAIAGYYQDAFLLFLRGVLEACELGHW